MPPQRLAFSVDTPAIFKEIADHFSAADNNVPGIVMALNEIRVGLARIAIHAIEIGDMKILTELERLGCVNNVV